MRPLDNVIGKIKGGSSEHDASSHSKTSINKAGANKKRLPVLIFPGFMSSALQVKTSPEQGWIGKRVWLSVASAGFSSLYVGGALKAHEEKKQRGEDYDAELDTLYQQELECKNQWLKHLKLSDDLQSDPSGIETRPLSGLDAVNYLDPGGLVKQVSWVFHHVTAALIEVGYQEGKDLDAAPYDWRIPPSMLESRDSHFTNIMAKIETMYEQNDKTPVVLLCHSMGCKTCHYFLNFVKNRKGAGQEWIDKYVHSYFPVGGPHLGAPKSLRGTVCGDKMGLEAFLNEEEALICARSFGSVPWMYPYSIPKGAPAAAYLRREGVIHVTVGPFDCEEMVRDRNKKPSKLRLDVTYNGKTLHSKYHSPQGDSTTASFPERFTFAAPPDLGSIGTSDETIRISLYESGIHLSQKVGCCSTITTMLGKIVDIMFPTQWWRHVPCIKSEDTVSSVIGTAAVTTANVATSAFGSATLLADSEEKNLYKSLTEEDNPVEFTLQLHFGDLRKMRQELASGTKAKDILLGETSSLPVTIKVVWQPPQHDVDTNALSKVRIASIAEDSTPDLHVQHSKDKTVPYEAVNGAQLLKSEFLPQYRKILTDVYEPDPLGPRTISSSGAPPVKRVKAVYGIDLPTEVSAVYRRRNIAQKEGVMKCLHTVDTSAKIDSHEFEIKDGLILETDKTPQTIAATNAGEEDTTMHRSGDGTVPYYSLQQSRKWQGKCDVTIDEIPQAEHREILGDERFLKILLDYVLVYPP